VTLPDKQYKNYIVQFTEVKPDMVSTFVRVSARLQRVLDETEGAPAVVARVTEHGQRWTYSYARGYDTAGERDMWPGFFPAINKALGGAETRALVEEYLRCIESGREVVFTHRPDLSRAATATTSN
jgi:hypothetical protein